jgi:hypothetical protein
LLNPGYEAATAAFSFVPDSGIGAAAFSRACTFGTVTFTSVIGRPWVGARVLTPSRSIWPTTKPLISHDFSRLYWIFT